MICRDYKSFCWASQQGPGTNDEPAGACDLDDHRKKSAVFAKIFSAQFGKFGGIRFSSVGDEVAFAARLDRLLASVRE